MNDNPLPNKKSDKAMYKEYIRKSPLGIMDLSSGKANTNIDRKLSGQNQKNIDLCNSKKDGKSYLNLSQQEKQRLINHMENNKKEVNSYKKSYGKRTNDSWVKAKAKEKSDLLELQKLDLTKDKNKTTIGNSSNKKTRTRVPNVYPNNFNFFLKNSTSNTNRTELNRRSNDNNTKGAIQSPCPCIRVFNKVNNK